MPGTRGHSGGARPGAGRKLRQLGRATIEKRALYAKYLAAKAHAGWEAGYRAWKKRQGDNPGPRPSSDDAEAAVAFMVNVLSRCALTGDGDARAAIHLDERLNGRVPVAMEHAGPGGSGPVTLRIVREDGYVDGNGRRAPGDA